MSAVAIGSETAAAGSGTAYPRYKASQASWIGRVPSHWQELPGFAVLREKQTKNIGLIESIVLSLSYGRIVVRPEEKLRGLVPESFETYQIVEDGDIIVRPTDLQNDKTSLRIGLAGQRGIITSAYLCLQPRAPLTSDYAYRLLHTYDEMKVFYGLGSGLRQNLDFKDFKRLPVTVPPVEEQERICLFLDQMDRRINRLIRAKRRMIELLNEQKQAIINRAVTRGLDPDVRLKPSGIDWLGDVPEHWEVVRLKNRVGFREGPGIMAADFRDDGVPLLRISCLRGDSATLSGCNFLDPTDVAQRWAHFAVQPGEYLLSASASTGSVCRVTPEVVGAVPYTGIIRLWARSTEVEMEYVRLFMMSQLFVGQIDSAKSGVAIEHFGPTHLKRMWMSLPPSLEQRKIVAAVQDELALIDRNQQAISRTTNLAREYRTRLIADLVTGKLDVRGVELPPLDDDEPLDDMEAIDESEVLLDDTSSDEEIADGE